MKVSNNFQIAILLLSTLFYACDTSQPLINVQNLNGNKITILGHRGMGNNYKYPGNSFESIEQVLSLGVQGAEIDVQITKDSVLVIFHDKTLNKKTSLTGMVRDYNWTELEHITYRSRQPEYIYLITVDSLFTRLPNPQNYTFSFDCRIYPGTEYMQDYLRQYVYAIKQVLHKHNMENRILIESSNIQFHQILKRNKVPAFQFITGKGIKKGIPIAEKLGLYGIGVGSSATKTDIALAHQKGFKVMTWTPKTRWANERAVKKNPDFIQTDQPIHLVKLLKSIGGLP